jgi:hypothetical protein
MTPKTVESGVLSRLLSPLGLKLESVEEIQALWAGYGHIYHVKASPTNNQDSGERHESEGRSEQEVDARQDFVLKVISPPPGPQGDESHLRKMFSYQVEQYFYKEIAPKLSQDISVAACFGTISDSKAADTEGQPDLMATLLSDLRLNFPIAGEKRAVLNRCQALAAIDWLAKFHGTFLSCPPQNHEKFLLPPLEENNARLGAGAQTKTLWLNGGYTYLATRRTEYNALARDTKSEWSAAFCEADGDWPPVAEMAARFLTPVGRHIETYIHGDVKSENLFSNAAGTEVAFFDFQYTGIGLGVCDLAKLFTCSVPSDMLVDEAQTIPREMNMQHAEKSLLERYLRVVMSSRPAGQSDYEMHELLRHWETALVDWCRFQASWGFWGNTEWLQSRVRFILKDKSWLAWLQSEIQT